jgi:hypothetical protein
MAERKAAIQLSLGLIVAVVFAVVLLSLAITWISDLIAQITRITDDLTKEASEQIKEIFSKTDQKFAVHPQNWPLDRGHELKLLAGIINKEEDSQAHNFVVNVIPTRPETASWVDNTDFRNPLRAQFNKVVEFPITISPASGVPAGTYVFYVIACIDKSFEQCSDFDSQNFESPQYIRITLQ